jgi:hypothetical protein
VEKRARRKEKFADLIYQFLIPLQVSAVATLGIDFLNARCGGRTGEADASTFFDRHSLTDVIFLERAAWVKGLPLFERQTSAVFFEGIGWILRLPFLE